MLFKSFFIASGVGLSPLYCGHFWPIVPAPDDGWGWLWSNWWNEDWQGKPKYSEKTCPSATVSTTNPTWPDPESNPGRRGGKPATNRLSYGAALPKRLWYESSQPLKIQIRKVYFVRLTTETWAWWFYWARFYSRVLSFLSNRVIKHLLSKHLLIPFYGYTFAVHHYLRPISEIRFVRSPAEFVYYGSHWWMYWRTDRSTENTDICR
jgi:hypothetical protein